MTSRYIKIRKILTQDQPVTIRNRSVPNPVTRQQGSKVTIFSDSLSQSTIKRPAESIQSTTPAKKAHDSDNSIPSLLATISLPPDNTMLPPAIIATSPPIDPIPSIIRIIDLTGDRSKILIGSGKFQCFKCKASFPTAGGVDFHQGSKECYDVQYYLSTLKVDHIIAYKNEPFIPPSS